LTSADHFYFLSHNHEFYSLNLAYRQYLVGQCQQQQQQYKFLLVFSKEWETWRK